MAAGRAHIVDLDATGRLSGGRDCEVSRHAAPLVEMHLFTARRREEPPFTPPRPPRTPSRGITHAALPSQLTDAAGPRSPLHRTSQSETAPSEPAAASRQNGL